jgi:hypothetical protein
MMAILILSGLIIIYLLSFLLNKDNRDDTVQKKCDNCNGCKSKEMKKL